VAHSGESAPPSLPAGVRRAILAIEQTVVDDTTGELRQLARANPDRVRAWLTERYPSMDTTEVEAVYPQVRKAMAARRQQERARAAWAAERDRVRAFNDDQLLAALWGCASRRQAADRKRPGTPWARRCAALFDIHDEERRRRGLPFGDAPPPARDRASRKAAKARMAQVAEALNHRPERHNDIGPTQLNFVNVAEDTAWMRPVGARSVTPQKRSPGRGSQENVPVQTTFGLPSAFSEPAEGTRASLMAALFARKTRQEAAHG
jgi:hypothetical protein